MSCISDLKSFMYFLASVFAYGQTSSGKTYTMTGITEYAIADIYDYIQKVSARITFCDHLFIVSAFHVIQGFSLRLLSIQLYYYL